MRGYLWQAYSQSKIEDVENAFSCHFHDRPMECWRAILIDNLADASL